VSVRIQGERVVDATREQVFATLTDPQVVMQTVPLVERFESHDADHWDVIVKLPLPMAKPLKLSFEVVEKRPPEHARLRSRGGGMVGGASVDSSFDLTEQAGGGTLVRFHAEISFTGMLSPVEKMLEPVAQRQAEKTLDAIEQRAGQH
jgi:carbon monoxide dehydrogenase subunit G